MQGGALPTAAQLEAHKLRHVQSRVRYANGAIVVEDGGAVVETLAPPLPPPPPLPAAPVRIAVEPAPMHVDLPPTHELALLSFSRPLLRSADWRPRTEAKVHAPLPAQVHCVTWNVFFGEIAARARWQALLDEALATDAHVMCFQEATAPFLEVVRAHPGVQGRYCLSWPLSAAPHCGYGCAVLVREAAFPRCVVHQMVLPSNMGRTLLTVELAPLLAISTLHAESLASARTRQKQLAIAHAWGTRQWANGAHVVCGDFNMADGFENASILPPYQDVWPLLHPDNAQQLTWDNQRNPTIHASNPGDTWMARCDRVILSGTQVRCSDISLLGTTPTVVADDGVTKLCPSDHFGLLFSLQTTAANQ